MTETTFRVVCSIFQPTVVAGLEGALVLCRAERSPQPLLDTAHVLEHLITAAIHPPYGPPTAR